MTENFGWRKPDQTVYPQVLIKDLLSEYFDLRPEWQQFYIYERL